jgi:hypothetical protein
MSDRQIVLTYEELQHRERLAVAKYIALTEIAQSGGRYRDEARLEAEAIRASLKLDGRDMVQDITRQMLGGGWS